MRKDRKITQPVCKGKKQASINILYLVLSVHRCHKIQLYALLVFSLKGRTTGRTKEKHLICCLFSGDTNLFYFLL